MNCVIWNCRGAGGKEFPALVRDTVRMYNLDFIAILEPRISGTTADRVIERIGLPNIVKVDAVGFSGGLWCLWKNSYPPIMVHSKSPFCIHLHVKPNSPDGWFLSIVYASSRPYQ